MVLYLGKPFAHVLRHPGLHGGDGLFVVGPATGAPAVGMRDVYRRGEEAVDLLHAGQQEGIVQGGEPGIGETLGHVEQQGRGFGQHAALRHQGRHPPLGVDGKVGGGALLPGGEIEALDLVRGTGFHQGDAHRHGTGTGGEIERQFGHCSFPCVGDPG
ncbi:hypothetical protein D3C77_182090 [compost metagenome]